MPITNSDVPKALQTAMRIEFLKAVDEYPGDQSWKDFTMVMPSTTDTETYGWLGQLPPMREFLGERIIRDLTETGFTLKNKTWEMTIGVKRAAWEDDKLGAIKVKVQGMADMYQDWLAENSYKALFYGDTTAATGNPYGNSFDGLDCNATTHDLGGGTIDNTGTTALALADVKAEHTTMMRYKGDIGRYLNVTPTHLVASPLVQWTARDMVWLAPAATTQPLGLKVLTSPYLNTGYNPAKYSCWALVDCSKRVKPIILQQRTELEFTSLTAESDIGFLRDEWLFGVRVRCAWGYGAYWLSNLQVVS
jgi:phage major head subunit gpT-like protein